MAVQLKELSRPSGRGLFLCLLLAAASCGAQADFQGATHLITFDEESLGYGKAVATDAVARLQARIEQGEVKLAHDEQSGYLRSVLEALQDGCGKSSPARTPLQLSPRSVPMTGGPSSKSCARPNPVCRRTGSPQLPNDDSRIPNLSSSTSTFDIRN
jgi:hypothetical protein